MNLNCKSILSTMVFPNFLITIIYLYFLMAVLLYSKIIIFCLLSSVITSDLNSVFFAAALPACTRRTVCGVHARTHLLHAHVLALDLCTHCASWSTCLACCTEYLPTAVLSIFFLTASSSSSSLFTAFFLSPIDCPLSSSSWPVPVHANLLLLFYMCLAAMFLGLFSQGVGGLMFF